MITYSVSNVKDCVNDLKYLLDLHYEEISLLKNFKLNPQWGIYEKCDEQGNVKVILCKDDDTIIGYIVFFISHHLHYSDCLLATEDIYFLKKEYRTGRTGLRMFTFAEEYLKSIHVDMVKYSTKVKFDKSVIFEYMKCDHSEKVFTKMLRG
jgi:hypothetical protein